MAVPSLVPTRPGGSLRVEPGVSMARDEFLSNLRTAVRFLAPEVQVNGIRLDPDFLARVLDTNATWLTPKAVEGFDAEDFPELPADQRRQLAEAVACFRAVAARVPRREPPPQDLLDEARPALVTILTLVGPYLEGFQVYHALKRQIFPDYVRDFAVRIGGDWTDDPAVWIWVIIADRVGGYQFIDKVPEVREPVEEALRGAGIDRWLYLRFRTESEQAEWEAEQLALMRLEGGRAR